MSETCLDFSFLMSRYGSFQLPRQTQSRSVYQTDLWQKDIYDDFWPWTVNEKVAFAVSDILNHRKWNPLNEH
jgi:hypothetical protein